MSLFEFTNVLIICIILCPQNCVSQIPTVCTDVNSLEKLECCPDECGSDEGRGQCADIDMPPSFSMTSTDVRANWPHYFTRACSCDDNYAGYDCSRCNYGYYGDDCEQNQAIARRTVQELSASDWTDYIDILQRTRTYDSGYQVVLEEREPGTTDLEFPNTTVSLYDLFIWTHHYAAKDSECTDADDCNKVDYAHEATGFPTWHRQYILWFEWEIQHMLKSMNEPDYHMFRLHYWDWRRETQMDQADDIFVEARLGQTRANEDGQPQVYGDLYDGGWNTTCWYNGSGNVIIPKGTICNPDINTGPLLRCPFIPNRDVCAQDNPDWPTQDDVNTAVGKPQYDTESFDREADEDSFRNFMEGFDGSVSVEECANSGLCICGTGGVNCEGSNPDSPLQRLLHNTVHIVVGIGDFATSLDDDKKGVMADVAASPNDPLFVNHHAMVDCVLEEWLQQNPDSNYPGGVPNELKGHQSNDYIVPFFPLYKHSEVFKTAENFGYTCRLPAAARAHAAVTKPINWLLFIVTLVTFTFLMI